MQSQTKSVGKELYCFKIEKKLLRGHRNTNHTYQKGNPHRKMAEDRKSWKEPLPSIETRISSMGKVLEEAGQQLCWQGKSSELRKEEAYNHH